jgi:hypothetical protein
MGGGGLGSSWWERQAEGDKGQRGDCEEKLFLLKVIALGTKEPFSLLIVITLVTF